MKEYLRKYELIERLGVSKTTLSNWIYFFHEFIPQKKKGDIMLYGIESIKVLRRIKMLREELYSRPTIKKILVEENFIKFHDSEQDNKDTK